MKKQNQKYDLNSLYALMEENYKDLKRGAWLTIKRRYKTQNLEVKYLGVDKRGRLSFQTRSGTTPGKWWKQQIEFKDVRDILTLQHSGEFNHKQLVNLMVSGDLMINCNDPSFKYYWSYKAWALGYGIRKETRFPIKRNPWMTGTVCKHLYSVLSVLPFYITTIVKDYRKKGLLKDKKK